MRKLMYVVILVSTMAFVGCVSAEDKKLISTMAAVGVGNVNEWDTLTADEKREAQFNMAQGACVLDHNLNGKDYPAGFAPVTSMSGQ